MRSHHSLDREKEKRERKKYCFTNYLHRKYYRGRLKSDFNYSNITLLNMLTNVLSADMNIIMMMSVLQKVFREKFAENFIISL